MLRNARALITLQQIPAGEKGVRLVRLSNGLWISLLRHPILVPSLCEHLSQVLWVCFDWGWGRRRKRASCYHISLGVSHLLHYTVGSPQGQLTFAKNLGFQSPRSTAFRPGLHINASRPLFFNQQGQGASLGGTSLCWPHDPVFCTSTKVQSLS